MTTPAHALQTLSWPDLQALQCAEGQLGGSAIVAYQAHVTAGCKGRLDTLAGIADHMRSSHGQVIAEDHTVETQLTAQDVLQPATGEARWLLIDLRIDDMRRHHRIEHARQALEWQHVAGTNLIETALVDRNGHVGIGPAQPCPGKCLPVAAIPA